MPTALLISNVGFDDPGGRAEDFATRRDLLAEHGWTLEIGRVESPYVKRLMPSVVRCYRRAKAVDADVIVSVSNPMHNQLIGWLVARLTRRPWIAEFRDPMVENPDREPGAPITRVARLVERLSVTRSDHVIWGDGIQIADDYYTRTYGVPASHVTKLPFKGYRAELFADVSPRTAEGFRITYAGSFYEGWIEPFAFLDGLGRFVDRYGRDDLSVAFYGDWAPEYGAAAAAAGVTDVIATHDVVPYETIIEVLCGSDVALYIGGDDPRNRRNVPSKIWDYIGARIPILAVVDPSFRVAELIADHGLGVVVPPDDPDAIADAIHDLRTGAHDYDPEPAVFERFTRRRKVAALADVLDRVVDDG